MAATTASCTQYPPPDYRRPPFPSLYFPITDTLYSLYTLRDVWRFTLVWTFILYALFHLSATGLALFMQVGKRKSVWKYLGVVPVLFALAAGLEALVAGTATGLLLGAVYNAGCYEMSTWIPFVWGLINVLILVVSSFTIQGGL